MCERYNEVQGLQPPANFHRVCSDNNFCRLALLYRGYTFKIAKVDMRYFSFQHCAIPRMTRLLLAERKKLLRKILATSFKRRRNRSHRSCREKVQVNYPHLSFRSISAAAILCYSSLQPFHAPVAFISCIAAWHCAITVEVAGETGSVVLVHR